MAVARLYAHRQDQAFAGFGLIARDNGKELPAHCPVDDFTLVGGGHCHAHTILLVGALLDHHGYGLAVYQFEVAPLINN